MGWVGSVYNLAMFGAPNQLYQNSHQGIMGAHITSMKQVGTRIFNSIKARMAEIVTNILTYNV